MRALLRCVPSGACGVSAHLRAVAAQAVERCGIDPRKSPLPRKRAEIEHAATQAAIAGSAGALASLQIEVLLDIRDLTGECAVRLSEIAAESAR